jgi:hypothetical protein
MLVQPRHGLLSSRPKQTYCGEKPAGLVTTSNLLRVTCPACKQIMIRVGADPGGLTLKKPGRPKKEK